MSLLNGTCRFNLICLIFIGHCISQHCFCPREPPPLSCWLQLFHCCSGWMYLSVCEALESSDSATVALCSSASGKLTWCVLTLCPPQSAVSPLETIAVIGTASCEWKIHPVLPTRRSSSSHVRYYFTNYVGDSDAFPSLKASFRIVWVSGIFKFWDSSHHSG